jgi:hypothetical protein
VWLGNQSAHSDALAEGNSLDGVPSPALDSWTSVRSGDPFGCTVTDAFRWFQGETQARLVIGRGTPLLGTDNQVHRESNSTTAVRNPPNQASARGHGRPSRLPGLRSNRQPRDAPTKITETVATMTESVQQQQRPPKVCPECGAPGPLYRTPRGLKCGSCVSRMDSSGLGFR